MEHACIHKLRTARGQVSQETLEHKHALECDVELGARVWQILHQNCL
jgi:hypothetical protein